MSPRGPRKLDVPETFKFVVECGRFDVIVEENVKRPGYVIMRRWKPGTPRGQWQWKALGTMTIRDVRGALLPAAVDEARHAANRWYMELTGEIATTPVGEEARPFTIGETWAAITDEHTGKYPHKTPFRSELEKALRFAVATWGADTAWSAIEAANWTMLIRRRLKELLAAGHTGIRGTEIMVSRLNTALVWLRKHKKIPANAAHIDSDWSVALLDFWKGETKQKHDPETRNVRYTVDETRKLLRAAFDVDPRTFLMLALGAELRLGQVSRCRRSDLNLTAEPRGELTVRSVGDKQGETVAFTPGQRSAVEHALRGYLRVFEQRYRDGEIEDYQLFPGGKLHGKAAGDPHIAGTDKDSLRPISREALSKHWPAVEILAGIDHVDGRGWYGIRRIGVDAALAEGISEQGLQNWGGWSSPDMPNRIYREKANRRGRAEAADVRARVRGEATE